MREFSQEELDKIQYARLWYVLNRVRGKGKMSLVHRVRYRLRSIQLRRGWKYDIDSVNALVAEGVKLIKERALSKPPRVTDVT